MHGITKIVAGTETRPISPDNLFRPPPPPHLAGKPSHPKRIVAHLLELENLVIGPTPSSCPKLENLAIQKG